MSRNPNDKHSTNKLAWIAGALLVGILLIVAIQGLGRGGAEAGGVTQAAPGDDSAREPLRADDPTQI